MSLWWLASVFALCMAAAMSGSRGLMLLSVTYGTVVVVTYLRISA